MTVELLQATVVNFDGVQHAKVKQGAYWPGFRFRLITGASPETIAMPVAQIRTAPADRDGQLVTTMEATLEANGFWHLDLSATQTRVLPLITLHFDVSVIDQLAIPRYPIEGIIKVDPQVTR